MGEVVVIDAVRTPLGARAGTLAAWHPAELAGLVLVALVERAGIDPDLIGDVVLGCATPVGAQGSNVARGAVLAAGLPVGVAAATVDRQGASGQQAVMMAAHSIMGGTHDIVIAGGVEMMSRVPARAAANDPRYGPAESLSVHRRYAAAGGLVRPAVAAEQLALRAGLNREALDRFALESHHRAVTAQAEGRFDREIVAVPNAPGAAAGSKRGEAPITVDESINPDLTIDELAALKPLYVRDGMVTAGNSARPADGAAAVLLMSEARASELGMVPRARFLSFAAAGVDPLAMLSGAAPATRTALEAAKLTMEDIDSIEVNESFAAAVLAWATEMHVEPLAINRNGGAIALGDPLGCSGARLLGALLNGLERSDGRYGLQAMTADGGLGLATIIERCA